MTAEAPLSTSQATSEAPFPAMTAAKALFLEGDLVRIRAGSGVVMAKLDPSVHPSVVATAVARGERVIVQREDDVWVVVGVLRTSPTPGIEEAEEYVIKAARVRVRAADEMTIAAGTASIAVRAYGAVETIAEQITSRASAVHKIIGRMLHLN